jgi:hypothetical protein
MSETPEQAAVLAAVNDEVEVARAKLQAVAAANARRVRAQDEENERASLAETLGRINAMAEQAIEQDMRETGRTREQIIAAAEEQQTQPRHSVVRAFAAERRRMVTAGVPELHVQHVGDRDPDDCEALRFVREHAMRRSGFLVLGGGKGVQKTGSACWMLGQVEGGVYVDATDLLDIAFHDRPMMLRLLRAKHVVLDDLGTEDTGGAGADSAMFRREFNKLWGRWYANAATVIVTCNLTRVQFDGKRPDGTFDASQGYGERIRERMEERGRFFLVGGASVRPSMREHWLDSIDNDRSEP